MEKALIEKEQDNITKLKSLLDREQEQEIDDMYRLIRDANMSYERIVKQLKRCKALEYLAAAEEDKVVDMCVTNHQSWDRLQIRRRRAKKRELMEAASKYFLQALKEQDYCNSLLAQADPIIARGGPGATRYGRAVKDLHAARAREYERAERECEQDRGGEAAHGRAPSQTLQTRGVRPGVTGISMQSQ